MTTNSEMMRSARQALKGQWGVSALLTLLLAVILQAAAVLTLVIGGALSFGYKRACLDVARGGKAEIETLFAWFKSSACFWKSFCASWVVGLWSGLWLLPPILVSIALTLGSLFCCLWPLFGHIVSGDLSELICAIQDQGVRLVLLLTISFFVRLLIYTPSICHIYLYTLTPWILQDDPTMSSDEAISRSMKLMRGHRWRFMCLQCRFLNWILLPIFLFCCCLMVGVFSVLQLVLLQGGAPLPAIIGMLGLFGLLDILLLLAICAGMLFLTPYYTVAVAKFYDERRSEPEIIVPAR